MEITLSSFGYSMMAGQHGLVAVNYDEWINRERRIRSKLVRGSPLVKGKRTYRLCQKCGELCLCHEETCPNCNGDNIVLARLDEARLVAEERIRCRFRFERLAD